MASTQELIAQAYAAFNRRDVAGALALMTEQVSWPKASEGGRVVGKEAIRAYWTRQWSDFDPHVEPVEVVGREDGTTEVRVHQVVRSLDGEVLSDSEVWHVHTIVDSLIERMELRGARTERHRRRSPHVRRGDLAGARLSLSTGRLVGLGENKQRQRQTAGPSTTRITVKL